MCRILVMANPEKIIPDNYAARMAAAFKTLSAGGNSDACGFAVYKKDGRLAYVRMPVPCAALGTYLYNKHPSTLEELVKDTRYLLVHARKATKGSPLENVNNHPFCDKKTKTCLIHNGGVSISSADDKHFTILCGRLGCPETDSAELLASILVLSKGPLLERARKAFEKFRGKASVAVADPRELVYTVNEKATIYVGIGKEAFIAATHNNTIKALTNLRHEVITSAELIKMKKNTPNTPKIYFMPSTLTVHYVKGELGYIDFEPLIEAEKYTYKYYKYYGYTTSK